MVEAMVLTEKGQKKLVADLKKILAEGKEKAQAAVRSQLVETYWRVGRRIAEEKLSQNAGYQNSIIEDVSGAVGIDGSTLRRCVIFFEQNKICAPRGTDLSWAHHKQLIALPDPEERAFYAGQAAKHGWKRDELTSAIKRDAYGEAQGTSGSGKAKPLKRPTEPFYIYKGVVERVVDGDTLLCRFDLGFLVWRQQRIRLAGIDCPEIGTEEGRRSFEFTRREMARVEWVVVKTNKIDIYGRYVGHVFYSTNETDKVKIFERGKYLSNELLKRGLARKF